jgi:hypothetical protein
LLDECVDWRLSRAIVGHEVATAHQMGWAVVKNDELLALAADHFDVLLRWTEICIFSKMRGLFVFESLPFPQRQIGLWISCHSSQDFWRLSIRQSPDHP